MRWVTIALDNAVSVSCLWPPVPSRDKLESPEDGCSGGWGLKHTVYKEMLRDLGLPRLEIRE